MELSKFCLLQALQAALLTPETNLIFTALVSFKIQNWDNFVSQIGDSRWCGGGSDRRLDISNPRL